MNLTDITAKITAFASGQPNTAEALREILTDLAAGFAQTGDVREIEVTNAYATANFDASGLGTNERIGWAIRNGNNGTRDVRGRNGIQMSATFPVLGATGGSETVTLVKNNIPILDAALPVSDNDNAGGAKTYVMATDVDPQGTHTYLNSVNTSSPSTPISIRASYHVTLYIVKL